MATPSKQSPCVNGSVCDPKSEAEAIDCLCHHSYDEHGVLFTLARLAAHIAKSEDWLRKAVSKHDAAHPAPRMHYIQALTLLTKNYVVYRYYNRMVGAALLLIPQVQDDATAKVMTGCADALTRFGQFIHDASQRAGDGVISPDDAASIARLGYDAIERIAFVISTAAAHAARSLTSVLSRVVRA